MTPELLREFLDYDPETGKLTWKERARHHFPCLRSFRTWHAQYPGREALTADNGTGYKTGIIKGRKFRAHRVVWAVYYGEWPNGLIDHINHDRADNRIANLRVVGIQDNAKNASLRRDNLSGRTGVSLRRDGLWTAHWRDKAGNKHAKYFHSFSEACEARAAAEIANDYHENHGARLEVA